MPPLPRRFAVAGVAAVVASTMPSVPAHAGALFDGVEIDLDDIDTVKSALARPTQDPGRLFPPESERPTWEAHRVALFSLADGTPFQMQALHATCRFQDDDTDEARPYRTDLVAYFARANAVSDPADRVVYTSDSPLKEAAAAAVAVEAALLANGWALAPSPVRVPGRFTYVRGDREILVLQEPIAWTRGQPHSLVNADAYRVYIAADAGRDRVCPRWPPHETRSGIAAVSEYLRGWRLSVPRDLDDWVDARAFRALRREGMSVLEIAELVRYGVGDDPTASSFEQVIERGRQKDRTALHPGDLDPQTWSGGDSWASGSVSGQWCFKDFRWSVANRVTFEQPAALMKDPGYPGRVATARVTVDPDGSIVEIEPATPLQSGRPRWTRAYDTFWTCLREAVSDATVSSGTSRRTGVVEFVGPPM